MNDLRSRLVRCFTLIFPDMDADRIPTASTDEVASWDSLSMIQLAAVVDEEFGTTTDLEMLPDLTSFDAFLEYLEQRQAAGC